jgi:hypothetical protein
MGICIIGCHLIDCALPSRRGQYIADHAQLLVRSSSTRFSNVHQIFCFNMVTLENENEVFQKQHMKSFPSLRRSLTKENFISDLACDVARN